MFIPHRATLLDNPHVRKAKEILTRPSDWASLDGQVRYLFICYTNRCGSNFLAELIASGKETNVAGEFFNADALGEIAARFRTFSLSEHLRAVMEQERETRLFAVKLALTHFLLLDYMRFFDENLSRSTFVFLERTDILGQAISMQIASQNSRWRSTQTAKVKDEDLRFSQLDVQMTLDDIALQNLLWRKIFAHNKLDHLQVNYERLLDDRDRTLARVADFVGIRAAFRQASVAVERQQTAIAERWRRAYAPV